MNPSQTLIILNPGAGKGGDEERIQAWVEEHPGVELRRTTGPGDAAAWARQCAEDQVGLVVAAGGDGTVHEVAGGLMKVAGSTTALGLLPLGTGNDLARTLDIPLRLNSALEVLERDRRRPMDVIRLLSADAPERYVLNALTGGFAGELHDAMDDERKAAWGPLSYLRCGLELWGDRSTWTLQVDVEGESVEAEVLNFVAANGATAGGGLPVAPGADPFDGILELTLILEAPAGALSALAASFVLGNPTPGEALVQLRGPWARVRASRPLPVSLDGERDELTDFELELLPGRLMVVVGGEEPS